MKTIPFSTRLFSLFVLLSLLSTSLLGQKRAMPDQWIGLHNFYYQNREEINQFTSDSILYLISKDHDAALSLGMYYRVIKEDNSYHHFDLFAFGFTRKEDLRVGERVGTMIYEPTSGTHIETTDIRFGYRRGKMFPLFKRLTADASVGGYPVYQRKNTIPLTSAGFPRRETWLGIGLNIHLGLNFQIHKKINIGYSFVPVAGQWSWYEERVQNPVLTQSQQITRSARMDTQAFESMLDFRNININYTIDGEGKFRKKKRR
ncbi:MAG: hypothetical protein ACRBG0_01205 [Lewinella sp.]|uniref:hypothetical protein n=1 Tax=Lewinella sp. TaxID=2004506 RepID=UPI003D6A7F97